MTSGQRDELRAVVLAMFDDPTFVGAVRERLRSRDCFGVGPRKRQNARPRRDTIAILGDVVVAEAERETALLVTWDRS